MTRGELVSQTIWNRSREKRRGRDTETAPFLLSVVMPVYNEVSTLEEILHRVRSSGVELEIIVVDDGSTDGTRELLQTWNQSAAFSDVVILLHDGNRGKGAAVRTALQYVSGDAVVVQDADLEYNPAEFGSLLRPIIADEADVVFGSRFQSGGRAAISFRQYAANRLLTTLSNLVTRLQLTDMETCYKVFRRGVIESIRPSLRECGFGIEPELTAKAARVKGVRFREVAISYQGRSYAEGKKIHWRDGLAALWCILRYGVFRR